MTKGSSDADRSVPLVAASLAVALPLLVALGWDALAFGPVHTQGIVGAVSRAGEAPGSQLLRVALMVSSGAPAGG